jgi:hypothetical protein
MMSLGWIRVGLCGHAGPGTAGCLRPLNAATGVGGSAGMGEGGPDSGPDPMGGWIRCRPALSPEPVAALGGMRVRNPVPSLGADSAGSVGSPGFPEGCPGQIPSADLGEHVGIPAYVPRARAYELNVLRDRRWESGRDASFGGPGTASLPGLRWRWLVAVAGPWGCVGLRGLVGLRSLVGWVGAVRRFRSQQRKQSKAKQAQQREAKQSQALLAKQSKVKSSKAIQAKQSEAHQLSESRAGPR